MNNFKNFTTPEEVVARGKDSRSLKALQRLARTNGKCDVCGVEDIWRYGGTGMCFSCTTGEADASEDYELIPSRPSGVHHINKEK